jgi:hypothetical protein
MTRMNAHMVHSLHGHITEQVMVDAFCVREIPRKYMQTRSTLLMNRIKFCVCCESFELGLTCILTRFTVLLGVESNS